jgi:probable rRNA maturation factor
MSIISKSLLIRNIAIGLVNILPKSLHRNLPKKVIVQKISAHDAKVINRLYRKKNKPANVLSFRYGPEYGEILVCPAVIRREAKAQGNTYKYQLTWMILHGMIHLAGLHHERSAAAGRKVEKIEQSILCRLTSQTKRQKAIIGK